MFLFNLFEHETCVWIELGLWFLIVLSFLIALSFLIILGFLIDLSFLIRFLTWDGFPKVLGFLMILGFSNCFRFRILRSLYIGPSIWNNLGIILLTLIYSIKLFGFCQIFEYSRVDFYLCSFYIFGSCFVEQKIVILWYL